MGRHNGIVFFCLLAFAMIATPVRAKQDHSTLRIHTSKDSLLLGVEKQVNIQVKLPPGIQEYTFQALYGEISDVSVKKRGRNIFAKYIPPEQFFPAVDIIVLTASDETQTYWGFATIRLVGQGKAKIVTAPNATTHVRIGSKTFGPATADARGEAFIDVKVPPGIAFGIDDEGNEVDLRVPQLQRVAIFTSTGDQINLDDTDEAEILMLRLGETGKLEKHSNLPILKADYGAIQDLEEVSAGAFRATYVVPRSPQKVTFTLYDASGIQIHSQQIHVVSADDFTKTAVKVEKKQDSSKEKSPEPAEVAESESKQPTSGEMRFFITGMAGANSNFGDWVSPSGKLSFSARLSKRLLFGIGYQFGILYSSSEQSVPGLDAKVSSKTLLFPNLIYFWFRRSLSDKWHMTPMLGAGFAWAHNRITKPDLFGVNTTDKEQKTVFMGQAALALEREFGPGMFLAQIGFSFYTADTLITMRDNLFTSELVLGYRFSFGS